MSFFRGATERPIGFSQLNINNPLSGGCTYLSNCDSHYPYDVIRKQLGTPAGAVTTSIGSLGLCLDTVSASVSNNIAISNSVDKLVPLDKVTVVTIRQKKDSTARSAANWGSSSFFRGAAPSTAGTLFWEFGTPNASVAGLTWDTRIDYLIYIAGPTKGREVWRNGQLIVKTSDTSSRSSDTTTFYLGNDGNFACDLEYVYYFGVFDHEWSDADCLSWIKNPWQLFRAPSPRFFVPNNFLSLTQSSSFVNSNTFFPHTINAGSVALSQSSKLSNNNSFYSHNVSIGAVSLSQSSSLNNQNTFYNQTLTTDNILSQSSPLINNNSFYNQTVSPGTVTVSQGTFLDNQNIFYDHSINPGSVSLIQSDSFFNAMTFYPFSIGEISQSGSKKIYLEYNKNNIYLEGSKNLIFSR